MRKLRPHFTPELRAEFCGAALGVLREDPREAAQLARLGEFVARELDDREGRNDCLSAWAQAAITQGEFKVALKAIDQAEVVDEPGPRDVELETLRVQALSHLERYDEARAAAARALAGHERLGNAGGMAWVEMNLAELAFREDRFRDQLRHLARTEQLVSLDERPRLRAAIATNRGNALEARNRFQAAERQFAIARALFAAEGCDHTVAQVDYNAAYAESLRGRYEDALRSYAGAASEFEALGDERHLAHIDLDCAEIHLHLNVPEAARKLAEKAEARFRSLKMPKERAQAWHLQGRAAHIAGELDAADEIYERAARQFGRLGLVERRYACMVQRGQAARELGLNKRARCIARKAERLLGDARFNPVSAAAVELLHAWLDLAARDFGGALRRTAAVLESCRRVHAPCVRIEALRIRGAAHRLCYELPEAIEAYTQAIEQLEEYRGGVPADEYMAAFLSGRTELYAEIVDLLVETGQAESAFEFAERAKSRALVDLLVGRHGREMTAEDVAAIAPRAQHLRERLTATYARLFRNGSEPGARSARSVRMARAQARSLENEMVDLIRTQRLENPAAASLDAVAVPDLAAIRASLQPDTTLVEYYLTGTTLFTFVVTRDDLHVVSQPAEKEQLRFLLEQFHFQLAKHERPFIAAEELVQRATRATLGKLAAVVLEPIRACLAGERLVIVPHGLLHHLPFHALPWDEEWLADHFEVTYAPSAAVYQLCAAPRRTASGPAAVFALPDEIAPKIEEEGRRVADRLSGRIHLGEEATFARLSDAVRQARIVHVATHGMFRHQQPMLSAIRLADCWANLYDLYGMDVRSELVVLSTCESGIADVTAGDEILGLTRGFLYAGAPALMTTQWRVDDAVTTTFMDRFYHALESLGDPAAAHRRAMAEIRAEHPHPYYWAPFFLTGRPIPRHADATAGPVPSQATRSAEPQTRPLVAAQRS